jgi:hypothetical protein
MQWWTSTAERTQITFRFSHNLVILLNVFTNLIWIIFPMGRKPRSGGVARLIRIEQEPLSNLGPETCHPQFFVIFLSPLKEVLL